MQHSTRLYVMAMIMSVMQLFDKQGLSLAIWALICLVAARVCEGAEYWQDQQHKD